MITLKNISKTFGKGSPNELKIFDGFNLEIPEKDFVVIVGSNGSGKSTLLNLIAGTIFPDGGAIHIGEKDITSLKEFERSKWIARIFQNPLLGTAPDLTILENFRLAALRTKSKGLAIGTGEKFKARVKEKISILKLGLETKLNLPMGSLSGGQRQALAVLMSIMDDTKILLLDEPTAALDPRASITIMELASKVITEFNLTALLVTHRMRDVYEYGNRVIQLEEGRVARDLRKTEYELNMKEILAWFA
jgi:putative ABC transport system ATP-binding protein